MRGLDPARTSGPGAMMPGHDVAVKAEPGHQQESPAGGASQVGPEHLPGGYVPGQCGGIASQSKMLSCQVLGSGRQHGDRYLGLLVDQRRDRSIAAHGHQAAAPRARFRLGHEHLPFDRSPGDFGTEAQFRELANQASNQEVVATGPGTPVGDDPHPRFTDREGQIDWTSVDMPVKAWKQLTLRKSCRDVAR